MNRIAPEIWSRLPAERPPGEALRARRAVPDVTERLLAALDGAGQRHLLILLLPGEVDLQDTQSRGIGVTTRDLTVDGHQPGRYLDVACHDASGHEAFDMIGGELAQRLASGSETATDCVSRVLAKWRRFWGLLPRQILSREAQLGLFAELWFLTVWLIPKIGAADAVTRWRGPFGSRHDFEGALWSAEVKATTSTRGRIHHINGLDQLSPPEQGQLLLFSLRLREEGAATNTLPSVVAACRGLFALDADALSRFETALVQAGYTSAHDEEYSRLRLRIVEEGLYAVRDDFPRLTLQQLPAGVPAGVERMEYDINLGGFAHLCMARTSAEMHL